MDEQKQDDQHEPTYRDVAQKTCLMRWTIEKGWRERVRDIRADGVTGC